MEARSRPWRMVELILFVNAGGSFQEKVLSVLPSVCTSSYLLLGDLSVVFVTPEVVLSWSA